MQPKSTPQGPSPPHDTSRRDVSLSATREAEQLLSGWYVGSLPDEPYSIPLVDRSRMRPELNRQVVPYRGGERPGTIVVDIDDRFLYLVQGDGTATRYGVGVGKQGFSWKGAATVGRKAAWPDWGPTATMVSLKPDLPRFQKGGLDNPLGARALYLYQSPSGEFARLERLLRSGAS
jgi:lipoprotein-anchoring transpeptidase ErfK/SrfK